MAFRILLNPFKVQWSLYVPPVIPFSKFAFCTRGAFMGFVCVSEIGAIFSLKDINQLTSVIEKRLFP